MGEDMDVLSRLRIVLAAALVIAASSLPAATLPGTAMGPGVGVNIHFTRGNTQSLDLMAAAGIRLVRTDFLWVTTEASKGVYDWSAYDELVGNLESRGLQPFFILDYSNLLYEQTRVSWTGAYPTGTYVSAPQHPVSVAAYSAWAKAAAAHFAGHNVIWEIWNEPNITTFWKPLPNAAAYSTLANSACNAIKSADPSAMVVGPASSGTPVDYLTTVLSSGLLNCIDAVSIHPYRTTAPETAESDFATVASLITQYAPAARAAQIQIISGEWGYYTASNGGVSTSTQASYVVRQQLFNSLSGVNMSIWYDWMNDGTDSTNPEHNFGLVNADLSAKPAYTALQNMTQQLAGYSLRLRLSTGNTQDYVLAFVNASGQVKLAYWSAGSSHGVSVTPVIGSTQFSKQNLSLTATPQFTAVIGVLSGG